jgi:hypothetical protein
MAGLGNTDDGSPERMTLFWLQIVDRSGVVVQLPGGGPLERDLIRSCTEAIVKRGVGVFRTEAHVKQAIAQGITEAIRELKRETVQAVK